MGQLLLIFKMDYFLLAIKRNFPLMVHETLPGERLLTPSLLDQFEESPHTSFSLQSHACFDV